MTDQQLPGRPGGRKRRATPIDLFPTFDEIAEHAHELFVAEGKPIDRVFECWSRAEAELLERAASKVIR